MHWLLSTILNCYPLLPTHFSMLSVMTNCAVESSKAKLWFLIQSRPKSAPTTPSEWRERAIWSLKSGLSSPHFGVDPPVHPTFWKGCRRSTSTNDPANERAWACHQAPSFKNIGLGGVPASNQAINSSESVCIPVLYEDGYFIFILRLTVWNENGVAPNLAIRFARTIAHLKVEP